MTPDAARFWINLFTASTWHTAQEADRPAAWFATRNRKLFKELAVGDLIVCYVARIGFTGVFRAAEQPRQIDDGPFADAFPVEVPAEPVVVLDLEEALPIEKAGGIQSWLVQSSGVEWPQETGELLVSRLRKWAENPLRRSLTRQQLSHRPRTGLASSLGKVTVPQDPESADDEKPGAQTHESATRTTPRDTSPVTDHVAIQARLLRIGRLLGLTPWVTPDDQSRLDGNGVALGELPDVTTNLPEQFDEATNRTIRHIDVMWLHRNRVEAAFEIESTTSIYSGLLRMADLLALQPNISIPLFLVVPEHRLERALEQLGRPVFRAMSQPLPHSCRVMAFPQLDDVEALVMAAGGHVTLRALEQFSVRLD